MLVTRNDMVRIGGHDCAGCSDCCKGMGDTIWLDPYDVYRLTENMGLSFEELLEGPVELHVENGLLLPNLAMQGAEEKCGFLDGNGRCSIHAFRPGFCRLFPLGRQYEDGKLFYFVLDGACPAMGKTKVKVEKWLGEPQIKEYEKFLVTWHELTKRLRERLSSKDADADYRKRLNMVFLQLFYQTPYGEDFWGEFYERVEKVRFYE